MYSVAEYMIYVAVIISFHFSECSAQESTADKSGPDSFLISREVESVGDGFIFLDDPFDDRFRGASSVIFRTFGHYDNTCNVEYSVM